MLVFSVKNGGWLEIVTSDGTLFVKIKSCKRAGVQLGFIGPDKIEINRKVKDLNERISQIKSDKP